MEFRKSSLLERFHAGYAKTDGGCWNWIGARVNKRWPYGILRSEKKTILAHRLSWETHNEQSIPEGLVVCHRCDNPRCVNPDHLFLGTRMENTKDRQSKGRGVKGENTRHAKLTEENVKQIRKLSVEGTPGTKLAVAFGVSINSIYVIVNKTAWKHID